MTAMNGNPSSLAKYASEIAVLPEEELQRLQDVHGSVADGGGDGTRTHDLAVMSRSL